MCTFERVARLLRVIESLDLEGLGAVASIAFARWRGESKLSGVHVAMAPGTVAWRPSVRGTAAARPVLFGRTMTTVASGSCVRTGEGPNGMVDPRRVPAA